MSPLSAWLCGLLGSLAPVDPAEVRATPADPATPALKLALSPAAAAEPPAPDEPSDAPDEPAAPTTAATAPAPKVPSPTAFRPDLVPAVRATPETSPRPAPAFVVAPPRPRPRPQERRGLPRGWAVDLTAGTAVPAAVGVAAQLETPQRLLVYLETGAMPRRYVDVLQRVSAPYRSNDAGDLLRSTGRRAFVVRAAIGVRPLRRRGLELRGGYTVVVFGEAVQVAAATIDALTPDPNDVSADRDITVKSTVHCIYADVGWRWLIRDRFLIRAALGYLQSLGADLYTEADLAPEPAERARLATSLGLVAEAGAPAAIRGPTAAVHVGYRF